MENKGQGRHSYRDKDNEGQRRRADIKGVKEKSERNVEWSPFLLLRTSRHPPRLKYPNHAQATKRNSNATTNPFFALRGSHGSKGLRGSKSDVEQQFSETDVWPGL